MAQTDSAAHVKDLVVTDHQRIDPISLMIARFAAAAERGGQGSTDLETAETLQFLFTTLAATQIDAIGLPLSQDPVNYPGHLIGHVAGRTLYVPFHLAEVFPSADVLQYLVEQAEAVRIFTDSTICLSGSAPFGMQVASDIDFCEYVSHTGKRVAQSFLSKTKMALPFCTEVKHGKTKRFYPWTQDDILNLCVTDTGRIGGKCTCPVRDWKFDYVGYFQSTGAIPISNLCVHEDDAEDSWSFQEIAITDKPRPIRYLVVPAHLGKYVLWLRSELEKYRKDDRADKALKRSLSLARILRLNSQSNRIITCLKSHFLAERMRLGIIDELNASISRLPHELSALLEAPSTASSTSDPERESHDNAEQEYEDLLDEVTHAYDRIMSRARELF